MPLTGVDTGVSPSSFTGYDVVVVGGGLSGLVLATRLTENPDITVGVLESGPWIVDDPKMETLYRMTEMFLNPEYQAVTLTVPQLHVDGRQLPCPRGRVLGGGSSLNFMLWHRGSKLEYDAWEALGNPGWNFENIARCGRKSETFHPPETPDQLALGCTLDGLTQATTEDDAWETLGNPGWNFENIARCGRKSETFHPPDTPDQLALGWTNASYHGNNGQLQTSFAGWITESQKAFYEVMEKSFGLARTDQWYNGHNTGLRCNTSSVDPRTGTRSSSAKAYYAPNASRPNLSVLTCAHADKVELAKDVDLEKVTGVHYIADGQTHFVRARKEVIICCGTLDTPPLLERSGIGRPSVLQPLGIDVKINNPNVGENLQDHIMAWTNYLAKPGMHTQDVVEDPKLGSEVAATYAAPSESQDHGPLGGASNAVFYVPPTDFVPKDELAEMKRKLFENTKSPATENARIQWLLDNLNDPGRGQMELGFVGRTLGAPPNPGRSHLGLFAGLQHPFSRGSIHIVSTDPNAHPELDPHYLENPWDKELFIRGLEYIDKASKEEPLASYIDRRVDPPPGDDTRATYEKFAVDSCLAGIHWVATASMLPKDKGGVVDPKCKVYGTTNLRIIDASIIPLHISAHTQATMYAMAEYASELLLEEYKI